MECVEIRAHLSAYVDGFLDPETKHLVERHVSTCEDCRKSLESLQTLVRELHDLKQVNAPDDFLERVHHRMTKGLVFHKLKKMAVPLRAKTLYPFATAAAMALLIFFVIRTPQIQKEIGDLNAPDEIHEHSEVTDSHKLPRLSQKAEAPVTAPAGTETRQLGEMKSKKSPVKKKERPGEPAFCAKRSLRKDTHIKAEAEPSVGKSVGVIELYLTLEADVIWNDESSKQDHETGIPSVPEKGRPEVLAYSDGRTAPQTPSRFTKPGTVIEDGPDDHRAEVAEGKTDNAVTSRREEAFYLKNVIERLNGKILSTEYDKDTGQPKILNIEIPADRYGLLCEKLHELGPLLSPSPAIETKGTERMGIRIHLIRS